MSESASAPSIPTAESLRRLLARRQGSLADTPIASLLLAIHVHELTVSLELKRNALEKQIVFDGGSPVECRSNIATESLGRFLVASGKLSEQDYRAAISVAAAREVPLEEVLVERNVLAATEVFRLLQQNLGRRLLDVFTWHSGTWTLSGEAPAVESSLKVNVGQLLLTGLTKLESQERVDEAVAALGDAIFVLTDEPLVPISELRLSRDQAIVVDLISRGSSMDQLRSAAGLAAEDANRIFHALLTIGAVRPRQAGTTDSPSLELDVERATQTAPPPVAAPPPAAAPEYPQIAAEELMRVYLSCRRKDAFELFELPEDVGIRAINEAFMRFSETYRPGTFPVGPDGLREKAQEVLLAAARAYAELADPDRRAQLLARREKRRQRELESPAVLADTRPVIVDPEALYAEGRKLADAGKAREALSYFEMAADSDAQNGTYASELAFCRFQLLISPAQQTLKSLKNALRIDPKCGLAYLYTGRVHGTLGNRMEAEAYLNRAAELMPRDPRVPAALRMLRTAK